MMDGHRQQPDELSLRIEAELGSARVGAGLGQVESIKESTPGDRPAFPREEHISLQKSGGNSSTPQHKMQQDRNSVTNII